MHNPELVLIVDDNPANLSVISETLNEEGFEIAIATSGERALGLLRHIIPSLILLDVMMPGIDGFETCIRLKSEPSTKDIPLIFMTALADPSDKVKGLSLGAVDYISKPFQHEEVLARINLHLNLRRLNLELENQKKLLEHRVKQRTEELTNTIAELQKTQLQLIQSEKMSGLGQLVAGIAHEINNPVNFIYGNIGYAQDYSHELLTVLQLYKKFYPEPLALLHQLEDDLDIDFVMDDFPKLLSSMKIGAERIQKIVISLRNFSRMDEADYKCVDIHEGIDSTLMILAHRIRANSENQGIQVIKDYYDEMPPIECYAGQLNQVFMNILTNAIDALEESLAKNPLLQAHIKISTQLIKQQSVLPDIVQISIADNGLGINEETKRKLFDPFFTTKPVGKGTGIGLSISHQIITQRHQGSLECLSTPGLGAEFVIKIPSRQIDQEL